MHHTRQGVTLSLPPPVFPSSLSFHSRPSFPLSPVSTIVSPKQGDRLCVQSLGLLVTLGGEGRVALVLLHRRTHDDEEAAAKQRGRNGVAFYEQSNVATAVLSVEEYLAPRPVGPFSLLCRRATTAVSKPIHGDKAEWQCPRIYLFSSAGMLRALALFPHAYRRAGDLGTARQTAVV